MRRIIENYKASINKRYIAQIVSAFVLLFSGIVFNYYSDVYAAKAASNPVSDIILSHTPVYNVDFFFIYGALAFWVFFIILCLIDPKRIPFSVKTIALFIIIRSISITLTHIAPFPNQLKIDFGNKILDIFSSSSSLFFSGHTGLPFLLALVYWKDKVLRYIMLGVSIFFAVIVLLGHLHYTIDVFSAFFITYSIHALSEVFFKKDRQYFYHGSIKSEV